MQLTVHRGKKAAEFWVTNIERQAPIFQKVVLPWFFNQFKLFGYFVTIYHSGQKNLYDQTSALLCYNRKRLAQLETEKEQAVPS